MPRKLLRNLALVDDDWRYAEELAPGAAGGSGIIVEFEAFQADRAAWLAHARLGVILKPGDLVETLAPDLGHLSLIAARFPGPTDGRGYSQAKLLRERYRFAGELRAIGYVRLDQLLFLARCGFDSFELAEAELPLAPMALGAFSAAYQPSNDLGLPSRLRRRVAPA